MARPSDEVVVATPVGRDDARARLARALRQRRIGHRALTGWLDGFAIRLELGTAGLRVPCHLFEGEILARPAGSEVRGRLAPTPGFVRTVRRATALALVVALATVAMAATASTFWRGRPVGDAIGAAFLLLLLLVVGAPLLVRLERAAARRAVLRLLAGALR